MGAWDYGPFDNDDAGDIISDIKESSNPNVLRKNIERALKCYDNNEGRAVANFIVDMCRFTLNKRDMKRYLKQSEQALERILDDEDWIEDWKDPEEIKKQIKEELKNTKRLLKKF